MKEFVNLFKFNPALAGYIGVEREAFLTRDGRIVPIAAEVIPKINHPSITNEFSACQIEDRIGPCRLQELRDQIVTMDDFLHQMEGEMGFTRLVIEVAPDDMPLDCYPTDQYRSFKERLTQREILAAHQVAGTHVHIGMRDPDLALRSYNKAVPHWKELCKLGDHSNGQRLALYPIVAKDYIPRPYASWREMYDYAKANGWNEDPKKCYHLIRISPHGTIEFRMFGATALVDEIVEWASTCFDLCQL